MKSYRVVEVFETIQGEGSLVGCPAVFVRFAGCNMWSGHDETRHRDAVRNRAACPLWCDTAFADGDRLDAEALLDRVMQYPAAARLIVFTGGEPLLQIDTVLLERFRAKTGAILALETNGTMALEDRQFDHVCVSPKVAPEHLKLREGTDLKVVYPAYNPEVYTALRFEHRFVQPQAVTSSVGVSAIADGSVRAAVEFCLTHPAWRLSMQTHKMIGVP